MKKSILLVLLAMVVLVAAAVQVSEAAAKPSFKPFVGSWKATDIDGSRMRLVIGGGAKNRYNVLYADAGASVCGKDSQGKPIYAMIAKGKGKASGNRLDVLFPKAYCMTSPKRLWGSLSMTFNYNPANDTLWDGYVTWKRTSAK